MGWCSTHFCFLCGIEAVHCRGGHWDGGPCPLYGRADDANNPFAAHIRGQGNHGHAAQLVGPLLQAILNEGPVEQPDVDPPQGQAQQAQVDGPAIVPQRNRVTTVEEFLIKDKTSCSSSREDIITHFCM